MTDVIPSLRQALADPKLMDRRAFRAEEKKRKTKNTRVSFAGWLESARLGADRIAEPGSITEVTDVLARLDPRRLSAEDAATVSRIREQVAAAAAEFARTAPVFEREVRAEIRKLRMLNGLRVLGQWVLTLVGLVLLVTPGGQIPAVLLLVGAILGATVLKPRLKMRARALSMVAMVPTQAVNGLLGMPPRGKLAGSGIWVEADRIWLTQLDDATRATVIRGREAERQQAERAWAERNRAQSGANTVFDDPRVQRAVRDLMLQSPDIFGGSGAQDAAFDRRLIMDALAQRGIRPDSSPEAALSVLRRMRERMEDHRTGADTSSPSSREWHNERDVAILEDRD